MKILYKGKTKDVYELDSGDLRLVFSDRVTGDAKGNIDPGGNQVAKVEVKGQGRACLEMSAYIFEKITANKVARTHMLSYDLDKLSMDVSNVELFSPGLEWIARWVATGSFLRRYSMIKSIYDGMPLKNPVFEVTLKDDATGDPLIVYPAISALGILNEKSLSKLVEKNENLMSFIHELFLSKGLDLWDIKVEWALDKAGNPILIDEISPGSCRAFKKGTKNKVSGLELATFFNL